MVFFCSCWEGPQLTEQWLWGRDGGYKKLFHSLILNCSFFPGLQKHCRSCSYLTIVTAAQLQWHLPNMNMIYNVFVTCQIWTRFNRCNHVTDTFGKGAISLIEKLTNGSLLPSTPDWIMWALRFMVLLWDCTKIRREGSRDQKLN